VRRKSSAITPRGGSVRSSESRNSATIRTTVATATALTIASTSFWSTKRQSFE
jgi:hypothetical protein